MRAEGIGGELRHGYAVAARIGRWSLQPAEDVLGADRLAVSAVLESDPYLIERRPLDLVLRCGQMRWSWPNVEITEGGARLIVRGAPIEGVRVLDGTQRVR